MIGCSTDPVADTSDTEMSDAENTPSPEADSDGIVYRSMFLMHSTLADD